MIGPQEARTDPTVGASPFPDHEHEVAVSRAEVSATLEALAQRLDPTVRAAEAVGDMKQAASDAVAFVGGAGLPASNSRRARNVRVLLATAFVAAAVMTIAVVRSRRR